MKMSQEHYVALKDHISAVKPLQEHGLTKLTDVYMRGADDGSIKCKDINMRLRWDLFRCIPNKIRIPMLNEFYTYMNDDHVDTALKHIMSDLYDEVAFYASGNGADTPMEDIEVEIVSIKVNK